jgi:hypothetical protein
MKAKITKITVYPDINKDGTRSSLVRLDDKNSGYCYFQGDAPPYKEGDEVEYTAKERTKKDGSGKYNILTISVATPVESMPPVKQPTTAPQPPSTLKPQAGKVSTDLVTKIASDSMGFIIDSYINNKFEWDSIPEKFHFVNRLVLSEVKDALDKG